jgi:hypothetical protein
VSYEFRSSSEYVSVAKNNDGTYTATINRSTADTATKRSIENNSSFYTRERDRPLNPAFFGRQDL